MYITDHRSSAHEAARKDRVPGSLKKPKASSIPHSLSWLNFTTISKQTRQLFHSDSKLASDTDNWRYTPQHCHAVSNLDEENRWTVHYKASWHQQENVFLPSSRSSCVEDLHRQAKVNLKTVLRDCDKLRKDGLRSSQYYSQAPLFSSTPAHLSGNCLDEEEDQDQTRFSPLNCLSQTCLSSCCHLTSWNHQPTVSSADEESLLHSRRSKTPVPADLSEIDVQTNWTKALPLPTPEERMRQQAQAIQTDVVPINVTGENFDRQAGNRRSLVHSDTPLRRPAKIKRRKTITGLPEAVQKELGTVQAPARGTSSILPGHFSTMSRLESSRSTRARSTTRDSSCQTEEIKVVPPSVRRIRAQKGQGIAAQLSGSSGNMSTTPRAHDELRFHSLPRPCARVSLQDGVDCTAGRWQDSCGSLPRRRGSSEAQAQAQAQTSLLPQELGGPQPAEEGALGALPRAGMGSSAEAMPAGKAPCWAPGTSAEILAKAREEHCSSSGNWSGSSGGGGSARQSPTLDSAPPPSPSDSAVCLAVGPRWAADSQAQAHRSLSDAAEARWNRLYLKEPSSPAGLAEGDGWRRLGERSLSRSISLRKSKKPPPPPARTDSLRRRAKGSGPLLSPSLIASLQRSLEGGLGRQDGPQDPARPSVSVSVEGPEPWLMRPRSQSSSNSSGRSTGGSNAYSTGAVTTPSQSETSSLRSDSGDPWAYYSQEPEGWRPGAWDSGGQPKAKSLSPDKSLGITSPSSGYSSQCNTPTGAGPGLGLPPPCRTSPRPKVKPKIPERRSSLRSSLSASSSSASLSSSASESRPQAAAAPVALSPPASDLTASDHNAPPHPSALPFPAAPVHLSLPPAPPLLESLPTSPPPALGLPRPSVPLPTSPSPTRLLPKSPSFKLRLPTSPPPAPPVQGLPRPAVPLPTSPPPTYPLPKSPSAKLPPSLAPPPAPPLFRLPLPPMLLPVPPSPPPLPSSPLPSAPLPPPPPLDLAALSGGKRLLRPSSVSCRGEPNARGQQGDAHRAAAVGPPLITADALRTVQLRSVRPGGQTQPARAGIGRHKPPLLQRPLSLQSPGKQARNASPPAMKTPPARAADLVDSESRADSVCEPETVAIPSTAPATVTSELLSSCGATDQGNGANTEVSPEPAPEGALTPTKSKLPGRMPPPIARKPKLSLLIPPSPWEITAHDKRPPEVSRSAAGRSPSAAEYDGTGGGLPSPPDTEASDSGNSRPAERPEGAPQPQAWAADHSDGDRAVDKRQKNSRTKEEEATDSSPTWEHVDETSTTPCQGNEIDDVFEESSASLNSSSGDCAEQSSTPSRPRTTEDLFAAIHRSKRRVLGRKDSEDEFNRTQSPSSPVTPTGSLASPCSLRQTGSIQRSLRKSSTSSDSFKALLLKKGSRPEQSCRMSAAEMLKSTDPRQRPAEAEPAAGRPAGQRGRNPREEWASHEGPMPRGAGLGVRYGRSRTPPSAASSRYSARLHQHRLHSSPMSVIREAEAWEATDDGRRRSDGDISAQRAVPTSGANTQENRDPRMPPPRSAAPCVAITTPNIPSQDWEPITSPSGAGAQGAAILTPGVSSQNWDPQTSPSQGAAILTAGDAKQDWDS